MNDFSNPLTEYTPQMELEGVPPKEPAGDSQQGIFDEYQEMEQAIALLEAADEKQLDHVLGDLIQKANREIGNAVSPRSAGPSPACSRRSRATFCRLQESQSDNRSAVASGRSSAVAWPLSRDRHWGSSWRA